MPYNFSSRNKTNIQTKKQSNLLTLTVSCEKRSCLIRSKKKKNKTKMTIIVIILIIIIIIIVIIINRKKKRKRD